MTWRISQLPRDEGNAYALHISVCPECARDFYLAEGLNEDGTLKPEDSARYAEIKPSLMTVEEGWQDLLRRCPDLAEACHRDRLEHTNRYLRRVSQLAALAACLTVAAGLAWLLADGRVSETGQAAIVIPAHPATNDGSRSSAQLSPQARDGEES